MGVTDRLVIFDVDGTLVDSQDTILAAMGSAFADQDLPAPERADVRRIVGLSLDRVMAELAPQASSDQQGRLVEAYKAAFAAARVDMARGSFAPLYPGTLAMLQALSAKPGILLAVATGKSRRGLDHVLDVHGLASMFVSTQVADDHPSKPHPSMIRAVLAETGVAPQAAVMIGDTRFDKDMANAAGVPFLGVEWGYHPADALSGGLGVIAAWDALPKQLDAHWSKM